MKASPTRFRFPSHGLLQLLLGGLSLLPQLTAAQTAPQPAAVQQSAGLSGAVYDANGQAVSFANVVLLEAAAAKLVTGTAAGADGAFQLPAPAPGSYVLKISMLGYATLQTPAFTVGSSGFRQDFGRLVLPADTKLLQEVKVQAVRPAVVQQGDKLVVSVAGSALASGSTALDVLTRAPGVAVDADGNLQLNGKAGVQVLIDGKRSYLTGKELQNLLQSMSADNLRDLEISSGAAARYDAQGSAGVINLTLKHNPQTGLSGSAYAGAQYSQLTGYSAGADLSYRRGRWNTALGVDMARRTRFRTMEMHREFRGEAGPSTFEQHAREEGTRDVPALRLSTDYALSSRHSLGLSVNLTQRRSTDHTTTGTLLQDGRAADDLFVRAQNQSRGRFQNATANLHYAGRLDSAGTTLSADLDYARLRSSVTSTFRNEYDSLSRPEAGFATELRSQNPTGYDIYAARVDLRKPLSPTTTLEAGAKASHVQSDNEVGFYAVEDGAARLDVRRSNHFLYRESVYAAYASVATRFGAQWQVQAGLRAEQTQADGRSLTLAQGFRRRYLGLFPSLTVQQTVSADYQLGYSFSRRLDRPGYESLNPFILYLDPYTWVQGNPGLKPQYTNAVEISQSWKQQYRLTLGYATTTGFIAEVPEQHAADRTTVFQQQNVQSFRSLSATLLAPVRVSAHWQVANNATLAYQRFASPLAGQALRNAQLMLRAQSTHTVLLPRQLRLELNAAYQGPMAYGLYRLQANWGLDAGLKRAFCHDQLDLSLSATDLLRTRRLRATANLGGNVNAFDQYTGTQSLRLTLRYRFRSGQPTEVRKAPRALDELDRIKQQ